MHIDTKNQNDHILNWKTLLAILSLTLSILIWFSGLVGSLQRPSVANNLELRKLELTSLGAPPNPKGIVQFIVGKQPEDNLREALEKLIVNEKRDLLLKFSLQTKVQQSKDQNFEIDPTLETLYRKYWNQPISKYPSISKQEELLQKLHSDPLLFKLNCEILTQKICQQPISESRAFLQIIGVTIPPIIALSIGSILLLRQCWLFWKKDSYTLPILIAPAVGLVDVILLISGGFVTLGETASSILVVPLSQSIANLFHLVSPLREAISIVLLYLGLSVTPIIILMLILRSSNPASPTGSLQLHWQPLQSTIYQAAIGVLTVCPLVVILEQLSKVIIQNPSGSNPLMRLLLDSHNTLALILFSFPAVVLAPLFEELIFRGVLLPVLARKLGPGWGILLSAFIFSIAHLSLGELAPLTALGIGLGWVRVTTGRLAPCVLMHAFWNSFTVMNLLLLGS